jgi:hypothetical protein
MSLESNPRELFDLLFNEGRISLTSKHLANNIKEGQLLRKVYSKIIILQGSSSIGAGINTARIATNTLLTEKGDPDGYILFGDDETKDPLH